ncbi:MAG: hypothetical protein ACFFD3_06230 [Candidatus Thorarchaeota archaeon]
MRGKIGARVLLTIGNWYRFLFILVLLLLFPYRLYFSDNSVLAYESLFFILNFNWGNIIYYNEFSFISLVNLLLVAIPSVYFTFRNIHRREKESMAVLALICTVLTFIVLTIIDFSGMISRHQVDVNPTPNLQYLPGFGILLLLFTVFVPIFREYGPWRTKNAARKRSPKSLMPSTIGACVALLLLVLPAFVQIVFLNQGNISYWTVQFTAPFYTAVVQLISFDANLELTATFVFGGYYFFQNIIQAYTFSSIFSFSLLYHLRGRIRYRVFLFITLVTLAPSLFLVFLQVISVLAFSSLPLLIPLPLLHIFGFLLLVRSKAIIARVPKDDLQVYQPEEVKVPVLYILRSIIIRINRAIKNNDKALTDDSKNRSRKEEDYIQ